MTIGSFRKTTHNRVILDYFEFTSTMSMMADKTIPAREPESLNVTGSSSLLTYVFGPARVAVDVRKIPELSDRTHEIVIEAIVVPEQDRRKGWARFAMNRVAEAAFETQVAPVVISIPSGPSQIPGVEGEGAPIDALERLYETTGFRKDGNLGWRRFA